MTTKEDPRRGLPSGSKMERLMHCPGSYQAETAYSQEEESDASKQGTNIHEAMQSENFDGLDDDSEEIASRLVAMIERAHDAWMARYKLGELTKIKTEKETRYWIKDQDGNDICSAQLDYVEICDDKALLVDYKTGYLDVTPSHRNHQIRCQAVALWRNRPELKYIRGEIASYRFKEQSSHADYDHRTLAMAYREIQWVCWRAKQPDAPRVPGIWCRYCKAKANCPECAAINALVPLHEVQPSNDLDIAKRVSELSPAQLIAIHAKKSVAEALFSAVANRIRSLDARELEAMGFKVIPSQRSKVKDIRLFAKLAIENDLIAREQFIEVCDVVLKRLVDIAVPRLTAKGVSTAKAAKERIQQTLEPAMEKYDIAPRIVKTNEPKELQ